ncbi:hypothetical protein K437DRAFT_257225 [Tilletiaria anomala UBC 951]|uniref:DNA damage-binding protein 1 n=1 Tax=Tilletiaria anomala (strain ATCC 24038 / CBS 436.72 / UBC 951) TaxID=1037660 RepID=A0A066VZ45_TILAU|nr:uncharacterized protein K437DRAFT_257225 [Tilletiaria anomala UBC 951]KDN44089.1 hypothetical protein K437DRAFT_257225 [Tilletiaria anomala UBC 951]
MHVISHLQQPTASYSSLLVRDLIPAHPTLLAVVQHTNAIFLALPSGSNAADDGQVLKEVIRLELNARIVALRSIPAPASPTSSTSANDVSHLSRLAILTDHHSPRLLIVRYDQHVHGSQQRYNPFVTESVLPLDEIALPAAELGIGLFLEDLIDSMVAPAVAGAVGARAASRHPPYIASHTHSGLLKVVPLASPVDDGEGTHAQVRRSAKGKDRASSGSSSAAKSGRASAVGLGPVYDPAEAKVALTRSAFNVRLPHPTLVASTFLDRQSTSGSGLAGGPTLALLSLSSSTSRIAGLGPQCVPVLSFHSIDADAEQLVNVPWGPNRKVPHPPQQNSGASKRKPSDAASAAKPGGSAPPGHGSSGLGGNAKKPKAKYGPSATGRTKDAAVVAAEEAELACSTLARSHVPLPIVDALGAHHLIAVPADWGAGVVVFCEGCLLYVPPPRAVSSESSDQRRTSSRFSQGAEGVRPMNAASSKVSTGASAASALTISQDASKRRKASSGSTGEPKEQDTAFSPASIENENRKRARRSNSGALALDANAEPGGSALSISPEVSHSGPLSSPASARRSSVGSGMTATATGSRMSVLKVILKMPIKVVAAAVIAEPRSRDDANGAGESGTSGRIVYCTHAGSLEVATLHFAEDTLPGSQPFRISVQQLGHVSRPGGPDGLSYLGEGFVHVASSSGDSMLVQIRDAPREGGDDGADGADAVMQTSALASSPPTSPTAPFINLSFGGAARKLQLAEVRRWPQIGPILDFVVDDGAGGDVSAGNAVQARVITASGTDSTGSLRVIRSGVSVDTLAEIELELDATGMWAVDADNQGGKLFILETRHGRRLWLLDTEGQLRDQTHHLQKAGISAGDTTFAVSGLAGQVGAFILVTSAAAHLLSAEGGEISVTASHTPANSITAASAQTDGSVLLATSKLELIHLQLENNRAFSTIAKVSTPCPVSCIHLQPSTQEGGALAAAGLWESNAVELYRLPSLDVVTPPSMDLLPHASLPRSVLLHRFESRLQDVPIHLFVGLGDGSIVLYMLVLPRADSINRSIRVIERKEASLGSQSVSLSSVAVAAGAGVFAACDRPTIIASDPGLQGSLTYSAVQARDVVAMSQLSAVEDGDLVCVALLSADRLQIAQLGEVQKLDITRVDLGHDDPIALARHPQEACVAVATWRFLPYGRRSKIDTVRGSVKVFDQGDFELLDTALLEDNERPNCVEVMRLGDGGDEAFVVVGTGIIDERQSETVQGRILGFKVIPRRGERSGRALRLEFAHRVTGNVYALAQVGARVAAAINSDVSVFDYDAGAVAVHPSVLASASPPARLAIADSWGCAFVACTLSRGASASELVVGDAMRSMCVLRVDARDGRIHTLARDCDPYWTTAAAVLDAEAQQYIGSDISFNVYISERARLPAATAARRRARAREEGESESEEDGFSHVMRRGGVWHYGDLINKFCGETLLPRATCPAEATPRLLFATAGGAIGVVSRIEDRAQAQLLSRVERNVERVVPPLGDISYEEWRTMRTEHRVAAPAGFLDGDMLQRFQTQLTRAQRDAVLCSSSSGGGDGVGEEGADVARVARLVESLARLC